MRRLAFILLFAVIALTTPQHPAYAHPHLFIKAGAGFAIDKGGITGLKIRWLWDEWWSEDVKAECDLDGNGSLNAKEIALVEKNFFSGVEKFSYFLKATADGKRVKIGKARNFTAKILADGTVSYEFTITLPTAVQQKGKIEICFADDTIYTAFEEKVDILGESKFIKKKAVSPYGDYGVKLTVWM